MEGILSRSNPFHWEFKIHFEQGKRTKRYKVCFLKFFEKTRFLQKSLSAVCIINSSRKKNEGKKRKRCNRHSLRKWKNCERQATSEFRRGRVGESVTRSGNRVTNALVRTSFVSWAKERLRDKDIYIYIFAGITRQPDAGYCSRGEKERVQSVDKARQKHAGRKSRGRGNEARGLKWPRRPQLCYVGNRHADTSSSPRQRHKAQLFSISDGMFDLCYFLPLVSYFLFYFFFLSRPFEHLCFVRNFLEIISR